jgi:hypothetical protein
MSFGGRNPFSNLPGPMHLGPRVRASCHNSIASICGVIIKIKNHSDDKNQY